MTVSCTQAPATQLGALATPYDPKTIPEPKGGGVDPVPDDLWTRAVLRDTASFSRARRTSGTPGSTRRTSARSWSRRHDSSHDVDLRTADEGGTFTARRPSRFIVDNIAASQAGINLQEFFDHHHRGMWSIVSVCTTRPAGPYGPTATTSRNTSTTPATRSRRSASTPARLRTGRCRSFGAVNGHMPGSGHQAEG